jgi:hypothetical protein
VFSIYFVVVLSSYGCDSLSITKTSTTNPFKKPKMTFNDGCLGSRNDEERSEMRYVMRIADSVNHQTFERTLRFR